MAPSTKVQISVLDAGASDSEDDLATATTGAENRRPNKTAGKGSKTKTMPRRASASKVATATKRKAAPKQNRPALKDRTNFQAGSDTEEVENFEDDDMEDNGKPRAKRVKTNASRKQTLSRAGGAPAKSKPTKRAHAEVLSVIPETQQDPEVSEDVSQSIEAGGDPMDISTVPTPPPANRFAQRPRSASVQLARSGSVQPLLPRPSARSASAQPGYPLPRDRSGSASGTERERRGGDPELRRKLNEMTKKHENLMLKYQNLQETGPEAAQSNFEKLKRASDQKAKDASELIASLKKEIAELKKSCTSNKSDEQNLQKQVNTLTTANANLTAENARLKESLKTSDNNLQVAQNEIKAIEVKFVAARQQLSQSATEQEKGKTAAASDAKSKLTRSVGANDTEAQKEAKMKENLYSDLTGLIIRGVKTKEGEDEYDCIQTGRNGTLHFHLSIANDATIANPKTPSGLSYEEAEFAYEPLLDESRDHDLIQLLPDYLREDICFPRNHAVKFYTRVVDSMTKKIVLEEE